MQVFEKGNFAGVEAMKANPRLYDRVAPMGVNDIIMAVRYKHTQRAPLSVPITAFDGLLDTTIRRGNMDVWGSYTAAAWQLVPVRGDHYFVSLHYRQVWLTAVVLRLQLQGAYFHRPSLERMLTRHVWCTGRHCGCRAAPGCH